jgi:hypothetical protein
MFHLDLNDFLVSSCIDYLQLHRRPRSQFNFLSRQGHDGVKLHWKQFTRINKGGIRCKFKKKKKN